VATGGPTEDDLLREAEAIYTKGDLDASARLFATVTKSPDAIRAAAGFYGLGMVALSQNRRSEASQLFEAAVRADDQLANAWYQLGRLQEHSAPDKAKQFYERALDIDPTHLSAQQRVATLTGSSGTWTSTQSEPSPTAQTTISHGESSAIYEYLRQDQTPLSRQTVEAIDTLDMRVHPNFTALVGKNFVRFVVLGVVSLGIVPALLYVRARSTTVTIAQGRLQIRTGILARRLKNVDLWHVREVTLERTFVNRLTGDGTLVLQVDPRRSIQGANGDELELVGIARGKRLEQIYQGLLNVIFLLRSSPLVKGFIQ
jgi:tetratricopeptide (TPR) repeat protein